MPNELYKIFTLYYAKLRNDGLENASNLDEWEYDWANLSKLDGYEPDESDFEVYSRRNNILDIHKFPKND